MTAAVLLPAWTTNASDRKPGIKALAFDAYTLFDTSSLLAAAGRYFPGKAPALMSLWRNRQFEYTWLRSLSRQYKDFWKVTGDALEYACASLQLELTRDVQQGLMQAFLDMKFVPDAGTALGELKALGLRLAILSNATPAMLNAGINNSGLQGVFDFVISTDSIKTYKPDPAAYQLGIDAFKVKKEEILFVAFGGWDEAGAKSFGYPTAWINASGLPVERLDVYPDFICKSLTELVSKVKNNNW